MKEIETIGEENRDGTREMAQQTKCLLYKFQDRSSLPGTHIKNEYSSVQLEPQNWGGGTAETGGLLESPKQPISELQVSRRWRGVAGWLSRRKCTLPSPDGWNERTDSCRLFSRCHKLSPQINTHKKYNCVQQRTSCTPALQRQT